MLELGTAEWADGDNPRILQYLATCIHLPEEMKLHDETAWCAAFVGWSLLSVGIESTRSAAARSYLSWARHVDGFPVGGVAVLKREDAANAEAGHVGFIVAADRDKILLLGGNQRNKVSLDFRPKARVIDVRWPVEYALPH